MTKKQVVVVGFMLFSMFFGAGNLIFPPGLGFEAGEYFWPAIFGFILTGVGLPLLGVIGGSLSEGGYRESFKKFHPAFAVGLLVVIYLTIGPFFAIPRTATTAYEIGIVPFLPEANNLTLFITSLLFFALVLWLALSPNNLADNLGKYLTPVLLITMALIIIRAIFMYAGNAPQPVSASFDAGAPFGAGFTEGYLTMDAIAAMAFAIIVLNSIRNLGITNRDELLKGTIKSALLAAILLALVYGSLGWIGNRVDLGGAAPGGQNIGTFLLLFVSQEAFGSFGVVLLAVVVFLACLTTATGLISSVAGYFNNLLPSISYRVFAVIFTLISFTLANQGLDAVIQRSTPVLAIIYPIAISAVALLFIENFIYSPSASLRTPVLLVSILNIFAVAHRYGLINIEWLESLPLFASELEWVPVLIVGYFLGHLISFINRKASDAITEH